MVAGVMLVLACASAWIIGPASAACNRTIVFYQFDDRSTSAADSPLVTNSTKGFIALIDQAITVGVNTTTSAVVGRQYGSISTLYNTTDPSGIFHLYASLDHRIATKEYTGTFLLQGSYSDIDNTRTLSVTGGTGDFLLARGWAIETFAIGSATVSPAVVRYECHLILPESSGCAW